MGAAAAALLALAGCSTPCDAPGGLCAPLPPITRTPPKPKPPAAPPTMLPSEPLPEAQTFAVADPDAPMPSDAMAQPRDQTDPRPPLDTAPAPLNISNDNASAPAPAPLSISISNDSAPNTANDHAPAPATDLHNPAADAAIDSGTSSATSSATNSATNSAASEAAAAALPSAMPLAAEAVPPGTQIRIALMLPLRSETLGAAADALRAGFLAAYEHERSGVRVTVIETGDSAQDTLASFAAAQDQQDIMVGPLARSAVTALAGSALVRKPTIALNYPESRGSAALPPQMLVMGLSIEDEARQVAKWAGAAYPGGSALILSAGAPWQRRIADAFSAQWSGQGYPQVGVEMSALNGYLSDAELVQLRARVQDTRPSLLFLAMDADQARQLRVALGPLGDTLPVYGTSALNPGIDNNVGGPELDNVRLLDLPWQVQRDHPAVMVYPHRVPTPGRKPSADMERLYALGIDAFRVARQVALHPGAPFTLDGVTGKLSVSFGADGASFERRELPAIYQNGSLLVVPADFAPRPRQD